MNLETLITILVVAGVIATIMRLFAGWTLANWLISFVLAILGGVVGWQIERWFNLPAFYTFPFPTDQVGVSVVWASIGALSLALLGNLLMRPGHRPAPRPRRPR